MSTPGPLAQTLIPDNMDNFLSYSVMNYLKRLKNQAKIEFDRLCNDVILKQAANSGYLPINKNMANGNATTVTEGVRVVSRTPLKKDMVINSSANDNALYLIQFTYTTRKQNRKRQEIIQ